MTLRQRLARAIDPEVQPQLDYQRKVIQAQFQSIATLRHTATTLAYRAERAERNEATAISNLDQALAELAEARAALSRSIHPSRWEEGR